MGLYYQFQTAIKFVNLIPFPQVCVFKFETIIQKFFQEGFDDDCFVLK